MAQKNTKSVSLDSETHEMAKKTADEYGISMLEVFEKATDKLNKKNFFDKLHRDFGELISINQAWKEEIKRREQFRINIPDGEKA